MGNITPKDTRNNLASSPIPNHKITNGINAKLGIFRSICRDVSSNFSAIGEIPLSKPKLKPILPPNKKPDIALRELIPIFLGSSPL